VGEKIGSDIISDSGAVAQEAVYNATLPYRSIFVYPVHWIDPVSSFSVFLSFCLFLCL